MVCHFKVNKRMGGNLKVGYLSTLGTVTSTLSSLSLRSLPTLHPHCTMLAGIFSAGYSAPAPPQIGYTRLRFDVQTFRKDWHLSNRVRYGAHNFEQAKLTGFSPCYLDRGSTCMPLAPVCRPNCA